jgi:hypothetical protein
MDAHLRRGIPDLDRGIGGGGKYLSIGTKCEVDNCASLPARRDHRGIIGVSNPGECSTRQCNEDNDQYNMVFSHIILPAVEIPTYCYVQYEW